MSLYTLFDMDDEDNERTLTGLSLSNAFNMRMERARAFPRYDRIAGGWRLTISTTAGVQTFETNSADERTAARELMEKAISADLPGSWHAVTDENFRAEQDKRRSIRGGAN